MVSTLLIAIIGVSLLGVIGGALGVRKLMQLRQGGGSSSSNQPARRRQSKGARTQQDDQE